MNMQRCVNMNMNMQRCVNMNMNIQRCVNMNMNMHRCVHCEIIMIIDYYLTKSLVKREDSNLSMHNYVINFVTQSCDISLPQIARSSNLSLQKPSIISVASTL